MRTWRGGFSCGLSGYLRLLKFRRKHVGWHNGDLFIRFSYHGRRDQGQEANIGAVADTHQVDAAFAERRLGAALFQGDLACFFEACSAR